MFPYFIYLFIYLIKAFKRLVDLACSLRPTPAESLALCKARIHSQSTRKAIAKQSQSTRKHSQALAKHAQALAKHAHIVYTRKAHILALHILRPSCLCISFSRFLYFHEGRAGLSIFVLTAVGRSSCLRSGRVRAINVPNSIGRGAVPPILRTKPCVCNERA